MATTFVQHELYTVNAPMDVAKAWLPLLGPHIPRFVYMSYGAGPEAFDPEAPVVLQSHSIISGMSFRVYEVRCD